MSDKNKLNADLYKEVPVEEEGKESAEGSIMKEPFNPSEININVKSPTISLLIDRLSQKPPEIDLFADFQRAENLWSPQKQSRLIESILIKFPLPAFYFDGTDDEKWLVVDGLQRLSSLKNFIIEKNLKLTGLEFLKDIEDQKYDDLSRTLKRIIDQTQVTAYIINPGTPDKVKFNIFKRINTGGLVLEPQEIRNALNQGISAQFVTDLANLKEFKNATENKIKSLRMLDREFTTRFVAFYINEPGKYTPDLDSFLNDSMRQIAEFTDKKRKKIKEDFGKAMTTAYKIFGNWAFRKADLYPDRRKPINKALFEVWSVSLAKLSDSDRVKLTKHKKKLINKFTAICREDKSFLDAITSATGDKTRVVYRFQKTQNLISEVLND